MFRGINAINVDEKGRMALPVRTRQTRLFEPEAVSVITIDPEDRCLWLYPLGQWEKIEQSIEALPSFNPVTRRIKRLLIGHATEVVCDGQSRVLIPPLLRQYAAIDRKAVLVGQGKKIEIWAEDAWNTSREAWLKIDIGTELPDALKAVVV
jgi:MraZ protein